MAEEVFVFPMSSAQQRLWFLQRLDPLATVYHITHAIRLHGKLHCAALKQALLAIQERHEIFRTTFDLIDEVPCQLISEQAVDLLHYHDLRSLDDLSRQAALEKLAHQQRNEPFDLRRGPLLRLDLLQFKEQEHVLLFTVHHLIFDGWSMGVFINELTYNYHACSLKETVALPELEVQYADFAAWQEETLQGERLQQLLDYWQRRLEGAPQFLELPADRLRPEQQSGRGGQVSCNLSEELSSALRQLSREQGVTLFMTLLSAFAVLMERVTGARDLVIGTPVAGRVREELEPLIGFFVNTLPLRLTIQAGTTFIQLLSQVKKNCIEDFTHQELPFEKLVETLVPERDLRNSPLFQVTFALQNTPTSELQLDSLHIEPMLLEQNTSKFDLSLLMQENGSRITGVFEYNSDIFEPDTVERFGCHFQRLLQQIVELPETELKNLQLISKQERERLLYSWNQTSSDFDADIPMTRLFEEQTSLRPQEIAIVCRDSVMTYDELNVRANRLAHWLLDQGLQVREPVALCLRPSVELIVAMIAVLKAGGIYLPLDCDSPPSRLHVILEDAGPALLLYVPETYPLLPIPIDIPMFDLHALEAEPEKAGADNPSVASGGDQPAYILYTSGSTGTPKGVVIPQRAVNRLVRSSDYLQIAPGDRVAQAASPAFDAATFEIWGPLLNGGCLVIIEKTVLLDPEQLARELSHRKIDILFLSTALFNQLADSCPEACSGLRCLLFGGEAVDPQRVRRVLEQGAPERLLHVYGPTETTTFASWQEVRTVAPQAGTIPIGRPLANTSLFILDEEREPVPIGIAGELYIGGPGLALGYLNREELTQERFITNPFGPGRLYKSGDLARYLRDGSVEFLGRADQQIKLRGFRIEPAEIEMALLSLETVSDCAVVLHNGDNKEGKLVAFVVLDPAVGIDQPWQERLRLGLKEKMPFFMLPAAFHWLERLPLNRNNKIDRHLLAAMDVESAADDSVLPQSETEQALAAVWCEVLGLENVGSCRNFFDLGGHSLLATRVISRIRDRLHVELPLKLLFEKPDLIDLARHIDMLRLTTTAEQSGDEEEFIL
ncbi:non-ribosomal peptide synthetase [Desulfopila sp. IMCC35008]|uniref:non-ribosomal peptide synthetase n=1 Tax=Desulfopila sp. IMCC35008 TaxID=2653858 RepID=UPI0013D14B96|nr:non-ribosomal peptide synthetase [Desulfopila sp. IMCC35008]